jgi:hypothetical protein
MAAKNLTENKRFVYRSEDKKPTTYLVPANKSRSQVLQSQTTPITEALSSSQTFTVGTPARRVVVIRNTKHAQINQGPVDLGDFGQTNTKKMTPVINNGVSVLLIELVFSVKIL